MKRDRFKKIYIEISNICNLNCSFCIKSNREKRSLSKDEFILILNKIKPYTKYLYFHVLGEPLLHPEFNELVDIAHDNDFYVNITSNGYLINNVTTKNIRQINISLHSFDEKYNKSLKEYLDDIYAFINKYSSDTYINLRLWVNNKNKNDIITYLEDKFNTKILSDQNNKLANNVYLNYDHEFVWPDLKNNISTVNTGCHALKDHVAILSDGTITACCLDANGKINLGNIFNDDIKDVLNSKLFNELLSGFSSNKRIHPLCKKCNFIDVKKIKD